MRAKGLVIVLVTVLVMGFSMAASAKPIVIGVPSSLYAVMVKDGIKALNLAVKEINAKGGVRVGGEMRPFKVVVADTRDGEPGVPVHEALMTYEKLIGEEKPDVIVIGAYRSEALMACMDVAAKYKVPHIATIALTPEYQKKFATDPNKYKYCFKTGHDAIQYGNQVTKIIRSLKDDYGIKSAYFLYVDVLWAKGYVASIRAQCKNDGWEIVGDEAYAAGATDFSPALAKAKAGKAQMIVFAWDLPTGVGAYYKQYVAMRVPALTMGNAQGAMSPKGWETIGPEIEYSIFSDCPLSNSVPLKKWPISMKFLDAFKKEYGNYPDAHNAATAYDTTYMLVDAIQRANSLDRDALAEALEKTDYKGVMGRIRFDKNHMIIFGDDPNEMGLCAVVYQWQKGVRVPVMPKAFAEGTIQLPPWAK
jgi:branched-chain amino acid transport system substrate-binding protein